MSTPAAVVQHRGMITLSLMLATVMQALDTTIANVALPHMQGSLQSSLDQISWVLTSYIVATAIATPLTGWLCMRYGRRQVFLVSVVGFTLASLLCGLSSTLWQVVAARVLQGLFGAALVPLSQAVLLDINPKEKVSQAMALWGAGTMVGPILGPLLGGWLTEQANWRWVFFINLPVGALAFYGIARYLPESRPSQERLDLFGFVSLSFAVALLQLFLDRGEHLDWFDATEIRLEAAGAAVALACFVVHTWTTPSESFLNRALLRDRNFVIGNVLMFVVGILLYATLALLPSLFQGLMGYPVQFTGQVIAPRGLATMATMMLVGRLLHYFDARAIMAVGISLMVLSLYQMTRITLDMDSSLFIISGVLQGIGLGLTFVPLSAITFATLGANLAVEGTPIFALLRNIGGSIGIAMVQVLLTRGSAQAHHDLSSHVTLSNPAVHELPAALSPSTAEGLAALNAVVSREAMMMSYVGDFQVLLVMALLLLPMLLLLRRSSTGTARVDAVLD